MINFEKVYKVLNYTFKDTSLLQEALTHPSFCYNKRKKCPNYQKLELLGDSVVSLFIIQMLMEHYFDLNEGEIAKRKASLVCTESLSKVARKIGLGEFIIMSRGEEMSGGKSNNKILEDVMESISGAIYLDGGFDAAKKFINTFFTDEVLNRENYKGDPKTRLQQWTQKYKDVLPTYTLLEEDRSAGFSMFEMEIFVTDDMPKFSAKCTTKKGAEIKSAIKMIKFIRDNVDKDV